MNYQGSLDKKDKEWSKRTPTIFDLMPRIECHICAQILSAKRRRCDHFALCSAMTMGGCGGHQVVIADLSDVNVIGALIFQCDDNSEVANLLALGFAQAKSDADKEIVCRSVRPYALKLANEDVQEFVVDFWVRWKDSEKLRIFNGR